MAQKVLVQLVDDIDGSELADGAGETVQFGLDGKSYEIDLSNRNAKALRKALATYIDAGRKVSGSRRSTRSAGSDSKAIRAWAKENGVDVPDRGRIPASVRSQYEAAN